MRGMVKEAIRFTLETDAKEGYGLHPESVKRLVDALSELDKPTSESASALELARKICHGVPGEKGFDEAVDLIEAFIAKNRARARFDALEEARALLRRSTETAFIQRLAWLIDAAKKDID